MIMRQILAGAVTIQFCQAKRLSESAKNVHRTDAAQSFAVERGQPNLQLSLACLNAGGCNSVGSGWQTEAGNRSKPNV